MLTEFVFLQMVQNKVADLVNMRLHNQCVCANRPCVLTRRETLEFEMATFYEHADICFTSFYQF